MTPYCSVGKIKVPKNPVKMFNHKNAMRRIRNSGRCRGYHETLGQYCHQRTPYRIYFTCILWECQEKIWKKRRSVLQYVVLNLKKSTMGDLPAEYPLTTQPLRDKIAPRK